MNENCYIFSDFRRDMNRWQTGNANKRLQAYRKFCQYAQDPAYTGCLGLAYERTAYVFGTKLAEVCLKRYQLLHQHDRPYTDANGDTWIPVRPVPYTDRNGTPIHVGDTVQTLDTLEGIVTRLSGQPGYQSVTFKVNNLYTTTRGCLNVLVISK